MAAEFGPLQVHNKNPERVALTRTTNAEGRETIITTVPFIPRTFEVLFQPEITGKDGANWRQWYEENNVLPEIRSLNWDSGKFLPQHQSRLQDTPEALARSFARSSLPDGIVIYAMEDKGRGPRAFDIFREEILPELTEAGYTPTSGTLYVAGGKRLREVTFGKENAAVRLETTDGRVRKQKVTEWFKALPDKDN